jgi:hypothetical protein
VCKIVYPVVLGVGRLMPRGGRGGGVLSARKGEGGGERMEDRTRSSAYGPGLGRAERCLEKQHIPVGL